MMKYKGYHLIFWGTLLVIFNINLGALVIFPDIVGYIVIAIGVAYVLEGNTSQIARVTKFISWAIVVGEGINWLLVPSIHYLNSYFQVGSLILGMMGLVMRYGLLEVEKENDEDEIEKALWLKHQRIYLIIHAIALVGTSFIINFPYLGGIIILLSFLKEIYWLYLIYQLKRKWLCKE